MSRGINKVIVLGHLGADPDSRSMPNGKAVTNLRVATSDVWKDKQTGDPQERTEWHSIVMFERLAEVASQYLRKGSQVYIEGSLRTRKWQDKEGKDRYTTEIVGRELQMLGSKPGTSAPQNQGFDMKAAEQRESARLPTAAENRQAALAGDFNDDIPF